MCLISSLVGHLYSWEGISLKIHWPCSTILQGSCPHQIKVPSSMPLSRWRRQGTRAQCYRKSQHIIYHYHLNSSSTSRYMPSHFCSRVYFFLVHSSLDCCTELVPESSWLSANYYNLFCLFRVAYLPKFIYTPNLIPWPLPICDHL